MHQITITPSSHPSPFRHLLWAFMLMFLSVHSWANGIGPGDEAARHHLQYLSDSGVIDIPLTSWPIPRSELTAALARIAPDQLNEHSYRSYIHLQNALGASSTLQLGLHAGSSLPGLDSFATDSREKGEARATIASQSQRASGTLSLSAFNSPLDGRQLRLDGTQASVRLGNWNLGAGRVNRWWGPGWQSSLILSHAARPSPGLFIERNTSQPFTLPLLKALGPWRLNAFANQLERQRFVPKAKLLGARFSSKPLPALEIGLSRTAQWGGAGRPENLNTLFDLLIGNDNRGDSGIDADASNEPGNQLGGVDWRYSLFALDQALVLYGQLIGEDEANGLPSREIGMIGIEAPLISKSLHGRIFLEFSDTTMRFLDNGIPNSAYEHSLYQSGYRYHGLPIGASSDNDSRMLTLGGFLSFPKGRSLNWRATKATLNWDGIARGNQIGPQRIETYLAHLEYQFPISERARLALAGQLIGKPLGTERTLRKSGVHSRIEFQF